MCLLLSKLFDFVKFAIIKQLLQVGTIMYNIGTKYGQH